MVMYGARARVMNGTTYFTNLRTYGQGGAIQVFSFSSFSVAAEAIAYFQNNYCYYNDDSDFVDVKGGAIYVTDSSDVQFNTSTSTIKTRYFDTNTAVYGGSAIMAESSMVVLNNVVIKNHYNSTAIQVERGTTITINNVQAYNNSAYWEGGVFNLDTCQSITISSLTAYNNEAEYGGALSFKSTENEIYISNTYLYNNHAFTSSGAIIASGLESDLIITNTIFKNNTSVEAGVMRAIETFGNIEFYYCTFTNNYATTIGVFYSVLTDGLIIKHSIFEDNSAE